MVKLAALQVPYQLKTLPVILMVVFLLGTGGCRQGSRTAERLAEDSAAAREIESELTFNNITLEQANEAGQTLWKVRAEQATYSQDKEVAQIRNPEGELFQDGKPIFRVQAQTGQVQASGQKIILRGQIIATDIRSGAVLRGDELVWTPDRDLLVLRHNIRGSHPRVQLSADAGRMYTRKRQMELSGEVTAKVTDPALQLQAEHLIWNMDAETLVSDRPVKVDRLQGNRIIDTASGNQASVNLKTKIATLTENARLIASDPPVQVSGNSIVWNLQNQLVVANQPLTVVHRQQQVTVSANQGRMDMQRRIFYLTQNVRVLGQRNQSQLISDRLTWTIPSQEFVAEGNVNYRQTNPLVTMRGPRAVGKLENQTVVVSGGRVATEIVPTEAIP